MTDVLISCVISIICPQAMSKHLLQALGDFSAQDPNTPLSIAYHSQKSLLDPTIPMIYPLDHLGVIQVTGADRCKFLQGQISCNTLTLQANSQAQLAVYCNIKGQVLASMYVIAKENAIYLQLHRTLMDEVISTLNFYSRFSHVEVKAVSETLTGIGFYGESSVDFAKSIQNQHISFDHTELFNAVDVYISNIEELPSLMDKKNISPTVSSSLYWELLHLERHLPFIEQASSLSFTPHQLNYHLFDGIDVKKGCYLGQEIIARVHFKTKPQNRINALVIESDATFQVGCSFFIEQHKIGSLLKYIKINDEQSLVLLQSKQIDRLQIGTKISFEQDDSDTVKIIAIHPKP